MVIVFVLSILAPFNLFNSGSDTSCYLSSVYISIDHKNNVLISIIIKCPPLL